MVMSFNHLSVVANHTWKAVNVVSFWTILYSPAIYVCYQVAGLLRHTTLCIVAMVGEKREPALYSEDYGQVALLLCCVVPCNTSVMQLVVNSSQRALGGGQGRHVHSAMVSGPNTAGSHIQQNNLSITLYSLETAPSQSQCYLSTQKSPFNLCTYV